MIWFLLQPEQGILVVCSKFFYLIWIGLLLFQSMQDGVGRAMDSCRLSAVVCRKEYILHVTRKGNRYGSMSLPSVTGASHVHTDKREPGRRDGSKAPACHCPQGLWVNVGPLIIRACWSDAAWLTAALFTTHSLTQGTKKTKEILILAYT